LIVDEHGGWAGILGSLVAGIDLTPAQTRAALTSILEGEAADSQIAGFIIALGMKGGTVPELSGLVDAMLDAASPLDLPDGTIDIVGSGGAPTRRRQALSVSTIAAFVAAAAGAVVCKHGSVRASSSSGSFDTLQALGIGIELDGGAVRRCVDEAGIGFAFAKAFHAAMRHAGPVRAELGVPTVFNFLGPLSHPGRVRRQVVGTSDPVMQPRMAGVLAARGSEHALVVRGNDGLDELTTTDVTRVYEIRAGEVVGVYDVDAAELGLARVHREDLVGGTPEQNAGITHAIFAGEDQGPRRDIVVLNAAAGLYVAGLVDDIGAGLELATAAIDDGSAAAKLEQVIALTNG